MPTTERVHPTPVYEFIGACVIAWVLWRMGKSFIPVLAPSTKPGKAKGVAVDQKLALLANPTARVGDIFAAYLVLTGVARFLVEFIRINPRTFFGLTTAQVTSAIGIVVGVALWWGARRTKRRA